jgi:hypothetical protein
MKEEKEEKVGISAARFAMWCCLCFVLATLIEYEMRHEYLVSQIVSECTGDIMVSKWVEKDL